MSVRTFTHLFFPHQSNNLKAKILHNSSLFFLAVFLVFYQISLSFLPRLAPRILGYAANIPPSEVIRLTNEKRISAGLNALNENPELSAAARAKGADMLARGYWAHVAPDGTQPWKFFTDADYKYRYAGENLARDFSDPSSAVNAWMGSPSHKENLLSPKYKEIGVAVVEGNLAGVDTTIIVQLFGTKFVDTLPTVPIAGAKSQEPLAVSSALAVVPVGGTKPQVLISPFHASRNVSVVVVLVLIALFSVDLVIVSHRRISRVAGRSFAHIAFFGMVLTILIILRAGQIL